MSAKLSPDGKTIAADSLLFDVATGEQVRLGEDAYILVTSDWQTMVRVLPAGRIEVWNMSPPKLRFSTEFETEVGDDSSPLQDANSRVRLIGNDAFLRILEQDPNHKTGDPLNEVRVIELSTGRERVRVPCGPWFSTIDDASPCGRYFIGRSDSDDPAVRIWRDSGPISRTDQSLPGTKRKLARLFLANRQSDKSISPNESDFRESFADWHPSGDYFGVTRFYEDRAEAMVVTCRSGAAVHILDGVLNGFSPDGKLVAVSTPSRLSDDSKGGDERGETDLRQSESYHQLSRQGKPLTHIVRLKDRTVIQTLKGRFAGFLPDGRHMLLTQQDESTSSVQSGLFDIRGGDRIATYPGTGCQLLDGGRLIATNDVSDDWNEGYGFYVSELTSGRQVARFGQHNAVSFSVDFDPTSRFVLTSGQFGRIWDTQTANTWPVTAEQRSTRLYGIFVNQGRAFITIDADGSMIRWNYAADGKPKVETRFSPSRPIRLWPCSQVDVSPDGRYVNCYSILFVDLQTGNGISIPEESWTSGNSKVTTSPDFQWVIVPEPDDNWSVANLDSGESNLDGSNYSECRFAFSSDSKFLAIHRRSGKKVAVCDLTAKTVRMLSTKNAVASAEPILEGKRLLTQEGTVCEEHVSSRAAFIYDVTTGKLIYSQVGVSPDRAPSNRELIFLDLANYHLDGDERQFTLIYDVRSGKTRRIPGAFDAASIDCKTLITTADHEGRSYVRLRRHWDVSRGRELYRDIYPSGHSKRHSIFQRDGKMVFSPTESGFSYRDAITGEEKFHFDASESLVQERVFKQSPNGRLVATAHGDGTTRLWDANGTELCRLVSFDDDRWLVTTKSGHFDTNDLDSVDIAHWIMPDEPLRPLPIEIFMRDYYEPGLLARVVRGDRLESLADFASLNRVQPSVSVRSVNPTTDETGSVDVIVEIESKSREIAGKPVTSGLRDVHLFRDGRLVGYHSLEGAKDSAAVRFRNVRLPQDDRESVSFTAYAFNTDGVKSETTKPLVYEIGLPPRKGKAYVVSIGVDSFAPHQGTIFGDLNFASHDAAAYSTQLGTALSESGRFTEVVPVELVSAPGRDTAKKSTVKAVFDKLSGFRADERALSGVAGADRLQRVRPEDAVFITFSTHGYTRGDAAHDETLGGKVGEFYLVPSDIGDEQGGRVLDRCISAEQLAAWLRGVDAGEMVMIIDACQSAGSTGRDFKPGPMGSRGLGQLAYNKKMRILAASQVTQPAMENRLLGHGLLSYTLLSGLKTSAADHAPADGKITVSEWLKYGEQHVPEIAEQVQSGSLQLVALRDAKLLGPKPKVRHQQPVLFDFTKDNAGFVIKTR